MSEFSFEKASKFTREQRFFDINYCWTPGLGWVVRRLYFTPVRPEVIVLLSLACGILAGWFYACGDYRSSLLGILFIQLKNYLDTVDGHLARAKGMVTRLGRFLDSIADAVAYLCLFTGIAFHLQERGHGADAYILAYTGMVTGFLLCSLYCYYIVSYKNHLSGEGINRTNEDIREEDRAAYRKGLAGPALFFLHALYLIIYGWQDRLVSIMDQKMIERANRRNPNLPREFMDHCWYGDKTFLARVSPLCFGTQILILSLFTLCNSLQGFLWFLIVAGNGYALALILGRGSMKVGP